MARKGNPDNENKKILFNPFFTLRLYRIRYDFGEYCLRFLYRKLRKDHMILLETYLLQSDPETLKRLEAIRKQKEIDTAWGVRDAEKHCRKMTGGKGDA